MNEPPAEYKPLDQAMELPAQPDRSARGGYIPSLDGWRAIAIVGVLITHDLPWTFHGHTTAGFYGIGGYGVEIFFAISGFLITTRILDEERLCGHFDIRRFYIRRLFRIQPVAIAYLVVVALLKAFHIVDTAGFALIASLFLFINFAFRSKRTFPANSVGHFWSLAVEEHFYILLSLLMLRVKRHRIVVLALLYFLFWLPLHLNYRLHSIYRPDAFPRETEWHLNYLLLAALAAVVLKTPLGLEIATRFVRPWVVFVTTVVAIPLHHFVWHGGVNGAASFVVSYLAIFWIVATSFHPDSLATRILESQPLRYIGKISYSLYLWHILFFFEIWPGTGVTNPVLLALSGRVVKDIAAFSVATLSYHFIERPMVRLGHRLAPAASPGRPELVDLPVETPSAPSVRPDIA